MGKNKLRDLSKEIIDSGESDGLTFETPVGLWIEYTIKYLE